MPGTSSNSDTSTGHYTYLDDSMATRAVPEFNWDTTGWQEPGLNKNKDSNINKKSDEFVRTMMEIEVTNDVKRIIEIKRYQEDINKKLNLKNVSLVNDYLVRCSFCSKQIKRSQANSVVDKKSQICCSVCSKRFLKCDKCNSLFHKKCHCKENHYDGIVNHYNANIPANFYKKSKKDYFFMGFEFEFEDYSSHMSREYVIDNYLKDISNDKRFYIKHDGTCGLQLEIVSHPMSWEYVVEEKPMKKIFKLSKLLNSALTDSCGFHIHVSRNVFTPMILYKTLKFFKENKKLIQRISRRPMSNINRWASLMESESLINKMSKTTYLNEFKKHQAINVNNTDTIEFRIFRGTLSEEMFLISIQFVRSLINYNFYSNLKDFYLYENYKNYINLSKDYPNLKEYLCV